MRGSRRRIKHVLLRSAVGPFMGLTANTPDVAFGRTAPHPALLVLSASLLPTGSKMARAGVESKQRPALYSIARSLDVLVGKHPTDD